MFCGGVDFFGMGKGIDMIGVLGWDGKGMVGRGNGERGGLKWL